MKRIPLQDRLLPSYSRGEEILNMVSHITGGALGLAVLVLCTAKCAAKGNMPGIVSCLIYGISMVALYTVSSVYHGLRPGTGKKVLQIIDHCTIYLLIAGTYTPIAVAFLPKVPVLGWGLLIGQWGLTALCVTLNAIDLKRYQVISMAAYIFMGWCIIFFLPWTMLLFTKPGFYLLLSGGISYTVGAVFYGIGAKKPWRHGVFHIFVVLGSLLQFLGIYFYIL